MASVLKELLFNDGEGIDPADFNSLQRFARAMTCNAHLGLTGAMHNDAFGVGALTRTAHLWSIGDGGAPFVSATVREIKVLPGVIQQWIAGSMALPYTTDPTTIALGDDVKAVPYYLDIDELNTTHDIGDASPRWDVVSILMTLTTGDTESRSFEDAITRAKTTTTPTKRRNVTITKTVTKGTPAGTPNVPVLPANHVPLYAVYVPALHNAVFNHEQIWDFRMPLGSFTIDVLARDVFVRSSGANLGSATVIAGAFGAVTAGLVNAELWFPAFGGVPHSARLVGVQAMIGNGNGSADFEIKRALSANFGGAASPPTNISQAPGLAVGPNIAAALRGNPAAGNSEFRGSLLGMNAFTNNATGLESVPVWITGHPNGYASRPEVQAVGTDNITDRVCMRWLGAGAAAVFSMARFHFAGGL